jgi:2,3-dihydroxy-2,3-dihydro-p-cumate dehydrogenase
VPWARKPIRAASGHAASAARARSKTVQGDLGEPASANELVHATLSEYGRIDVLVNNAGGGVIRPTLEHTEETLRATLDRNLLTALRTTLATLPHMRDGGYGRIVFVGADSVRNGLDRHAVYNAAKGGVHAFARDGITVNTVAPSATATPELAAILARQPEVGEAFVRVIPVGRPAALEEVASAVAYLAAEEAGFITGQVLSVNGGANMGSPPPRAPKGGQEPLPGETRLVGMITRLPRVTACDA